MQVDFSKDPTVSALDQGKIGGYDETYPQSKLNEKIPGLSRESSPHSATSNKEENQPPEAEKEEPPGGLAAEEAKTQRSSSSENFLERRARAIAAKAQEIEKVIFYRADSFQLHSDICGEFIKNISRIFSTTRPICKCVAFIVLISSWKFVHFL
ncbi:unnamed protein product [Tetraodon nigroviridis]|uniref:(spotted green pufferfish) hypothetical protein n=1 Tax=Tetraodon nigroviridis TaxID=99883 RepID=Q4RHN2_TETNG|nr:unnamed protein product [Tetraodon nigroviridis]